MGGEREDMGEKQSEKHRKTLHTGESEKQELIDQQRQTDPRFPVYVVKWSVKG